jgi:hypothetical protein
MIQRTKLHRALLAGGSSLPIEMHRAVLTDSGADFRVDAYLRGPWREALNGATHSTE